MCGDIKKQGRCKMDAKVWQEIARKRNRWLWDLIDVINGKTVKIHDIEEAVGDAMAKAIELREHVEVDEKLLADLERLLESIPECPAHGRCIPHAIEWVEQHKTTRRNDMELKIGDKLIFEPAEVVEIVDEFVRVKFPGSSKTNSFIYSDRPNYIKVLGLVGDEGLEAEVGMEVYDEMWTLGRVINVSQEEDEPFPVKVDFFDADTEWFAADGTVEGATKRTLYVTKKPEKLGWAWYRPTDRAMPTTHNWKLTRKQAEEKFGDRLIHWTPE
jgi:hypothetical protein